jgi:hypothetical protein
MKDSIPIWPGYNVLFLQVRSEIAVHLAGATVFALVGFRRVTPVGIVLVLPAVVMASVMSRGAMLAFVFPVVFAALVLGKARELIVVLVAALVIFATAYAVETAVTDYREARSTP